MALIIVTLLSLIVAAVMSVAAWRLAREERRRSEARVAALAADIDEGQHSPVNVSERFLADEQSGTLARPLRALVIGVLVVGGGLALGVLAGGSPESAATLTPSATEAAVASPPELVALEHERDGDRLIVRGVVRFSSEADLAELSAVLSVLDGRGMVTASGQAPVSSPPPQSSAVPHLESTFVVVAEGARDVSRYRIGFKRNGHPVAHVDKRQNGVVAELP
jgi:hypothetical protein